IGFDFVTQTFIPAGRGDLMSYCDPQGISPFDVSELLKHPLLRPPAGPSPRAERPGVVAAAATTERIIVTGWARRDGADGALDPLYRIRSLATAPPSVDGGSHCLRFSGAAGPMGDYCFQLGFQDVDGAAQLERQHFTLLAPLPAGATRVALMAST